MSSSGPILALLLLLLGATVAGGVFFYATSRKATAAELEAAMPANPVGSEKLARLEREVAELRAELGRSAAAGARERMNPVTDAQIDAAVARYFAAHGGAGAAAEKPAEKKNVHKSYLQLLAGAGTEEWEEIFKALRASGQTDEMLDLFKKRAADNPGDADAQAQLGFALCHKLSDMPPGIESGRVALLADQTFDKALEIDPEHWDARFVKAQALSFWPAMFGKQATAIEHFEILRKQQESRTTQKDQYAETYLLLGNLYSQQGKADKAKEAWSKGARLFPQNDRLRAKVK